MKMDGRLDSPVIGNLKESLRSDTVVHRKVCQVSWIPHTILHNWILKVFSCPLPERKDNPLPFRSNQAAHVTGRRPTKIKSEYRLEFYLCIFLESVNLGISRRTREPHQRAFCSISIEKIWRSVWCLISSWMPLTPETCDSGVKQEQSEEKPWCIALSWGADIPT